MNDTADIGRCKIAKQRIELEPDANLTEKGRDVCLPKRQPKQTKRYRIC